MAQGSNRRVVSFDQFADAYSEILDDSISLSGEDSMFFAELKMKLLYRHLCALANKPLAVLDYGCGIGRTASFVERYFPQSTFFGVDPSKRSIAIARKNHPEGNFRVLRDGKLPGRRFDIIFASCVFHHVPPPARQETIQQLHGALKERGYFAMFEHNPYNPLTVRVVKECPFDKDAVLVKPKEAKKLFKQAGFSDTKLQYYFFFPKLLSFLRPCEKMLAVCPLGAQYLVVGKK